MKTKSFLVITGLLLAAASYGAPLMETTAIHSQPDTSSPAISYLKAGTDPIELFAILFPQLSNICAPVIVPSIGYLGVNIAEYLQVAPTASVRQALNLMSTWGVSQRSSFSQFGLCMTS